MADDVLFQIGGHLLPCPDFSRSDFSGLGDIAHQYLDGSPLYLGQPSITYVWPRINDVHVQTIRTIYDSLVTGINLSATSGTPVSVAVPDYLNGGLKLTTGYMLEPTGTAKGDGTTGLTVTFYQLGEAALLTALTESSANLFEAGGNGWNIVIGASPYLPSGWQFY